MRSLLILVLLAAAVATALAQFNGCAAGFCNQAAAVPCAGGLMNADNDCIINADNSNIQAAP